MKEFNDLLSFADHLVTRAVAIAHEEHKALIAASKLVQKDARDQIGHYQPATGPFQDWAPLADSTEDQKSRLGYTLNAPLLREGDLRDSIEYEVVGNDAVIGSKMEIAAYQEFGTDKIPPRPFMGPAAYNNQDKIKLLLGKAMVNGLVGGDVIHKSLGYDIE